LKYYHASNSVLWDKSLRKVKKRIYKTTVQSVMIHRTDASNVSRTNRNKLLATEMDCLQRIYRRTRVDGTRNEMVTEMMEMKKDIADGVRKRQLKWFGHTDTKTRRDGRGKCQTRHHRRRVDEAGQEDRTGAMGARDRAEEGLTEGKSGGRPRAEKRRQL
jgi:hypothetical protein